MIKDLKVMMIGNSFSLCVGKNLPQIVHSVPGNTLMLASAYIGGCSCRTHWENLVAAEKDDDSGARNAYQVNIWYSDPAGKAVERSGNVKELLTMEKWDVVTIQQASYFSPDYASYQPWADQLIAYIKKHAPQAEIVIQQTWAYRADDRHVTGFGTPALGFHQQEMYERLTAAYRQLAKSHLCRIIPTGLAVQLARRFDPVGFRETPPEEREKLRWPDLPPQAGDPVGRYEWSKNPEGEMQLNQDAIHLNERGEYLQACVWFSTLYGLPATAIACDAPNVGKSDAAFLRRIAQQAVDSFTRN